MVIHTVRTLGVGKKIASKIKVNYPQLLDVNFGSTNHSSRDAKELNTIEAVSISRDRNKLSEKLSFFGLPTFKSFNMDDFFDQEDGFNILKFKDKVGFPCFLTEPSKRNLKISSSSELLDNLQNPEEIARKRVESILEFDQVFIIHGSPWIDVYFEACMPKKDFFNRYRSKDFHKIEYTGFTRHIGYKTMMNDAVRAIKIVGLDFAEVNIVYNLLTNKHTIVDVKSHVKFDDTGVITSLYSRVIPEIADEKYK